MDRQRQSMTLINLTFQLNVSHPISLRYITVIHIDSFLHSSIPTHDESVSFLKRFPSGNGSLSEIVDGSFTYINELNKKH